MSMIEKALGKTGKSLVEKAQRNKSDDANNTDDQQTSQAECNKEYLSKPYSDEQKVEAEELPRSTLIEIDLKHLSNQGLIVPNEDRSVINEEYRRIKQPLINNIKGQSAQVIEKANLIQVTSAIPGEGKSFTAINLALAISQEFDHTVLLVDGDLLRPSLNEMFGYEERMGLSEYLSGDIDSLSEVLLTTNIPKLTLLPAGKKHHLTSELFSSKIMENLFDELSERYNDRVIIIDSPPIINTNEANILSRKVGQTVFVIEQNRTTQAEVKKALSQFDDDSIIGIVMNKSRGVDSGSEYGYYY